MLADLLHSYKIDMIDMSIAFCFDVIDVNNKLVDLIFPSKKLIHKKYKYLK